MSLSAASPRGFQLYSPRHPSPLGLPPIAPPDIRSAYPKTPDKYDHRKQYQPTPGYGSMRNPLGTSSHRATRAPPPAPLYLDAQYHPAAIQLSSIDQTLQPPATPEIRVSPSPSVTSTSSLSVYSDDSAQKGLSVIREEQEGEEVKKGVGDSGRGFCLCFSFSALFGAKSKSKPTKVQPQVIATEPAAAPQMAQPRRRPPSIVHVR